MSNIVKLVCMGVATILLLYAMYIVIFDKDMNK